MAFLFKEYCSFKSVLIPPGLLAGKTWHQTKPDEQPKGPVSHRHASDPGNFMGMHLCVLYGFMHYCPEKFGLTI